MFSVAFGFRRLVDELKVLRLCVGFLWERFVRLADETNLNLSSRSTDDLSSVLCGSHDFLFCDSLPFLASAGSFRHVSIRSPSNVSMFFCA